MAKFRLYDWKAREYIAESKYLEPVALACLAAKGKYEVSISELDELIEVEDDSVLKTYVPEPKTRGPVTVSSKYDWNYQLFINGKMIWSGSFDESIFEDAYSAAKHGKIELVLWPIEAGGLPIGIGTNK